MKIIRIKAVLLVLMIVSALSVSSQVSFTQSDSLAVEQYLIAQKTNAKLPINQLLIKTALHFTNIPYVVSTLENNKQEQLVVNLHEFDCTTFVESCIALSKTLKWGKTTFADYCNELQHIRYRNGAIKDYTSRLHYMTDWVFENSKRGLISDISQKLGATLEAKEINYMSTHIHAYKALRNAPELQNKTVSIEKEISKRQTFYYLKKADINSVANKIKDGDIVIFATTLKGMDYSHVGIAYHNKGKLGFIHASSKATKVLVEPLSLSDYCAKQKLCTGITVLRLK